VLATPNSWFYRSTHDSQSSQVHGRQRTSLLDGRSPAAGVRRTPLCAIALRGHRRVIDYPRLADSECFKYIYLLICRFKIPVFSKSTLDSTTHMPIVWIQTYQGKHDGGAREQSIKFEGIPQFVHDLDVVPASAAGWLRCVGAGGAGSRRRGGHWSRSTPWAWWFADALTQRLSSATDGGIGSGDRGASELWATLRCSPRRGQRRRLKVPVTARSAGVPAQCRAGDALWKTHTPQ
jgi:hypothetical protein